VERWLAQRRTREIFGILLFLIMISFQFTGPAIERYSHKPAPGIIRGVERLFVIPATIAARTGSGIHNITFRMASFPWISAVCDIVRLWSCIKFGC